MALLQQSWTLVQMWSGNHITILIDTHCSGTVCPCVLCMNDELWKGPHKVVRTTAICLYKTMAVEASVTTITGQNETLSRLKLHTSRCIIRLSGHQGVQ